MKRILKELELTHISAVDKPCQEGATVAIMKRDPAVEKRDTPQLKTTKDLSNAVRNVAQSANPDATKRHIVRRARALGATGMLPKDWQVGKQDLPERITKQLLGMQGDFADYTKAFDDVLDNMVACDGGDDVCAKFDTLYGDIAAVVADPELNAVAKHDTIYTGIDGFLGEVHDTYPGACAEIEKAFDNADRIRKLKKRIDSITEKARKARKGATHTTVPYQRGLENTFGENPTSGLPSKLGKRIAKLKAKLNAVA